MPLPSTLSSSRPASPGNAISARGRRLASAHRLAWVLVALALGLSLLTAFVFLERAAGQNHRLTRGPPSYAWPPSPLDTSASREVSVFGSILTAVGMTADGVAEGLYAIRHGFSARAAGVAYAIGAVVAWLYNAVAPITFTVESITVATRTATKRPQILYIVALSAIPSIALGPLASIRPSSICWIPWSLPA
ncbi:MAG: hypothetical protein H0V12_10925 [Chloroflexi bacterium]|nr:hypothetical protein [Chloroflexota bacterium]